MADTSNRKALAGFFGISAFRCEDMLFRIDAAQIG
jgi:hypothetical protein